MNRRLTRIYLKYVAECRECRATFSYYFLTYPFSS